MKIMRITETNTNALISLRRLLGQLTSSETDLDEAAFKQLVQTPNSYLLAAMHRENLTGILMLTIYRIPSSLQARIDDVVVDSSWRRKGTGRRLLEEALRICRQNKVAMVNLSCHPRRSEATRLYLKMGFVKRETNVYGLDLRKG